MEVFKKYYSFNDFKEEGEPDEKYILGSTTVLIFRSNGIERTYIIDSLTENFLVKENPSYRQVK